MRFIFRILLVITSLAFMQASQPKSDLFLTDILLDTRIPDTGEYVYIYSPGGIIDKAFSLVPEVSNKTCIVFGAASAALMIILPACKERYYVTNAVFQFHSASAFIPPFMPRGVMISQWDAEFLAAELARDNDRIVRFMLNNQVPFSEAWIRQQMKNNTVLVGNALGYWSPWARPVSECIHCPEWTKMVDMKNALTVPSN